MGGPSRKKQRREEYRAQSAQNGEGQIQMPKKKFYRQRAHANPFSDHALEYPTSPEAMDWTIHFPAFKSETHSTSAAPKCTKAVEIADIGCGFGGLIVALSPLYPETLMLGMELRTQVTDYVINRIAALRSQNPLPAPPSPSPSQTLTAPSQSAPTLPYHNISALRTNTMKFLPNYFAKASLRAIFLCFPDPHFKQRKHKARIVSAQLSAEYAYVLRPGGKVYTITDVEELHEWMVAHFVGMEAEDAKELWERVPDEENGEDEMVRVMREETEEGKKVTRNGGRKYVAVFRRREDPDWPE